MAAATGRKLTPAGGSAINVEASSANSEKFSRPLEIAVVIDLLVKDGLSLRQSVWNEIEKLAETMFVSAKLIQFEKLDFGETCSLDLFYNADVAVVDLSVSCQRTSLFYHLGVRESMDQKYNVVLYTMEEVREPSISLLLKFPFINYKTLLYALKDGHLVAFDCNQVVPNIVGTLQSGMSVSPQTGCTFCSKMKKFLKEVQIEASAHSREKFLCDLRQARQEPQSSKLKEILAKLRSRLDDPDVLSVDTVVNMLLSYSATLFSSHLTNLPLISLRDIQDYAAMVSLVEDIRSIPNNKIYESPAIQFNYAFALNRRNIDDDRARALELILDILKSQDNEVPDFLCLAGRIYKDRFSDSRFLDIEARDQAIYWYRKGFETQPNEYAGINLATLLVIAGHSFQTSSELQQIAVILSGLLGRKGSLSNMQDYWDVATFFEISVLAENYFNACQAAQRMFILKPPAWFALSRNYVQYICQRANNVAAMFRTVTERLFRFLKSTIGNIGLIEKFRRSLQQYSRENQMEYRRFLFWMDYFVESTKADDLHCDLRFPVLSMEPSKAYTPSYVSVNKDDKTIFLWHVTYSLPKSNFSQWIFPAESIRAVSAAKRDDRAVYLYVYLNSDDFMLFFPTDSHRHRFLDLVDEITSNVDGTKLLGDYSESQTIDFEFELDASGQRVVLGKGTFGAVYAGRDRTSQRTIAIKEVQIKNHEEVQPLMEEIQLHSTLAHTNIVQYLGCEVSDDNQVFRIFMEQVPGGSLSLLLRNKWGPLIDSENTMAYYAKQILEGLAYLHSQKIVHRDIKGDNVLVNTYSGLCKIVDFGTCKRLAGLNPVTDTFTGTLQYMAPEVIDHGQRGYGAPADVWSFGCTMIEMATGKPPFVELGSPQAAIFKVGMFKVHPPIPEKLSSCAKSFISRCFAANPKQRPSAAVLLNDYFFDQTHVKRKSKVDINFRENYRPPVRSASYISASSTNAQKEQPVSASSSVQSLNELTEIATPSEKSTANSGQDGQLSTRFFMMRKDYERRDTLSSIMLEFEDELVDLWVTSLKSDVQDYQCSISKEVFKSLLGAMRSYVIEKDKSSARNFVLHLKEHLDNDESALSQVCFALFVFQDVMHYVLRQQKIKPHWMFSLDNLTQSCSKCFIELLSPAVQNANGEPQENGGDSSSYASTEHAKSPSVPIFSYEVFHSVGLLGSQVKRDMKEVKEENQRLLEEVKSLCQICEDVRSKLAPKCRSLFLRRRSSSGVPSPHDCPNVTADSSSPEHTDTLVKWLRELNIDEETIDILKFENYSLEDLLCCVKSRRELVRVGIRAGVSCRLWKHIKEKRKQNGDNGLEEPLATTGSSCSEAGSDP
ncbi:mitogen activated protein kinase kinase kinase [Trichuris trichiura]|uniref:Mitogen activated protein kinase kinase kinase n=1 Tax=Trichuris trichiura TaxID=36087 RepID=A0A077Z8N9_TRITR|nr:mitogen activated protein kinase kinase kinase [Trichuris trichiura]